MQRIFLLLPLLILGHISFCQCGENFWKEISELAEEGQDDQAISLFSPTDQLRSETVPHAPPVTDGAHPSTSLKRISDPQLAHQLEVAPKRLRSDHDLQSSSGHSSHQQPHLPNRRPRIDTEQPTASLPRTLPHAPIIPPLTQQERLDILKPIGDKFGSYTVEGLPSLLHPYAGTGEKLPLSLIKEAFGRQVTQLRRWNDEIFLVPGRKTQGRPNASFVDGGMELKRPTSKHLYVWKRLQPPDGQGSIFQFIGVVETGRDTHGIYRLQGYTIGRVIEPIGSDAFHDTTLLLEAPNRGSGRAQ